MFVGIVLLALNLRAAVTSLGAVLEEVRLDLGLSGAMAGLLTALPALCFAIFGGLSSTLARRFGPHRVVTFSIAVLMAGLVMRVLVDTGWIFLLATGTALAGMAVGNVLIPPLVKRHFPNHVGPTMAAYTTALAVGTAAPVMLTVPISQAAGTWRWGLAVWAVTAVLALVPWLGLLRHDRAIREETEPHLPLATLARSPLAWSMAIFFGGQSLQAYAVFGWLPQVYRDAGYSPVAAGNYVGLLLVIGIPVSLAIPAYAARRPDQRLLVVALCAVLVGGYAGLLFVPQTAGWLWATLIGVGLGNFPLVLTLIGLRARTHEGTSALSAFTQGIGYLIAASGPFIVGVLYEASGSFTVPLAVLMGLVAIQLVAGLRCGRPQFLEDEVQAERPVGDPASSR